jgi:alkanesulfonate monooxygenase SsuD/methylene tetrahydromethanopterin reductase-like flavin-dependent oxidoreductase (luciferase family)
LKFTLIYPNQPGFCDPDLAASISEAAEQAGFETLLVWDHYSVPWGADTVDAWAFLAFAAARTSRIKLGTCVTPIPFRPPAQLAKIISTVDLLSKGRAILGVGAGWHQPEFDGFSKWDSDAVRVAKTIEGVELIKRLWTEDKVDHAGEHYTAIGAELEPKPVSKPHPPMWFGVRGPRMLRLAAEYADAWIPTLLTPQEYAEGKKTLGELRAELGKSPEIYGALQVFEPPQTTDEALKDIEAFAKAGCDEYGIVWSYPPEESIKRIDWFAREVMSREASNG